MLAASNHSGRSMPFFFSPARISALLRDESGAVSVDWVVLTSAIVGLGIGTVTAVRTGTASLGSDIDTSLSGASVASLGCLGAGNTGAPAGFECYTGPTIGALISARAQSNSGTCTRDENGNETCTPGGMVMFENYQMSDGRIFTKVTSRAGDGALVTYWRDASGNTVPTPPPT